MWVLNFAHPLSVEHRRSIEQLVGDAIEEILDLRVQFDHGRSFAEQAAELIEQIPLTPDQWQHVPLLVNPPSFAAIACTVLAELHGLMGYFPAIVRLRPIADRVPPQFEVAEVIQLQAVRERARQKR